MVRRRISKQAEAVVEELNATANSNDNYKPVLIVDNYATKDSQAVQHIYSAVEEAGYKPEVIRHSEALKIVKSGGNLLEEYDAGVTSGSGKPWNKNTGKDRKGRTNVTRNDAVHKQLATQDKPVYAICGGGHAIAEALGNKIVDTGKFYRGIKDGDEFNNKYGVTAEGLKGVVRNLETYTHQEEQYVKSFEKGKIKFVQHHAERTEEGRQDIANFLNKHTKKGKRGLGGLLSKISVANDNEIPSYAKIEHKYERAA